MLKSCGFFSWGFISLTFFSECVETYATLTNEVDTDGEEEDGED